jgi:heme-degrading monooxygenase HmoA
MYAVVNHLHLSIPVDQIVGGMEREAIPLLKGLPGFRGINLVKVASDRAIVVLFWDSAANADNGAKTFGPTWFAKNIAPYLASEQQRSVGEVIVHG